MKQGIRTLVASLLLLSPSTAFAQEVPPKEAECKAAFERLDPASFKAVTTDFCRSLAGVVIQKMTSKSTEEILKSVSPRDVQSRSTNSADLAGTAGQGAAVPTAQPAGVAAGTLAAVGTDAGSDAIAALTINPFVLFVAEKASAQLAKLSRVADFTVFIPVSNGSDDESSTTAGTESKLKYFGVRARYNFIGASSGGALWKNAGAMLEDRIARMAKGAGTVLRLLVGATDIETCGRALLDSPTDDAAVTAACGAPLPYRPDTGQATSIHEELLKIRRAADAKYFGADFRYDHGDPTLGQVENSSGQFLFVGLAFGRRFDPDNPASTATSGLRGRIGVRNAKLDSQPAAEWAIEASFGFELARRMADDNELAISVGVDIRETRGASAAPAEFQANYSLLRASVSLPLVQGAGVSLNLAKPLTGDVSPTVSVNFNWGLLLSNRPGR